jgi:hypothetical protein
MDRVKTGGRKLGTPNKVTSELRDSLKQVIDGELNSSREMLNAQELTLVHKSD